MHVVADLWIHDPKFILRCKSRSRIDLGQLHWKTGRLNEQVASDLGAAEKTIKIHQARAIEKLKGRSIVELIRLTDKAGVCATPEQWHTLCRT
jgi:hypothetical protein